MIHSTLILHLPDLFNVKVEICAVFKNITLSYNKKTNIKHTFVYTTVCRQFNNQGSVRKMYQKLIALALQEIK